MNMTNGLTNGLQLTITNNGNPHRTHGTPVNISRSVLAAVTHTLAHNPMVAHHPLHTGIVAGMIGMRTRTGMVQHGKA